MQRERNGANNAWSLRKEQTRARRNANNAAKSRQTQTQARRRTRSRLRKSSLLRVAAGFGAQTSDVACLKCIQLARHKQRLRVSKTRRWRGLRNAHKSAASLFSARLNSRFDYNFNLKFSFAFISFCFVLVAFERTFVKKQSKFTASFECELWMRAEE